MHAAVDAETVSIPTGEYAALTHLEAQVRRIAAKRTPVSRDGLSMLLKQIQTERAIPIRG